MVIWRAVWPVLTLAGCGFVAPRLAVHREAENQNCRAAPLVIVGVIESDGLATRAKTPNMQLRRMSVRVENVLRGELAEPAITVYYFSFYGYSGPRPLGVWDERSLRRVFWLERDSGVFRTSCDGVDSCTLAINSGTHRGYRLAGGKTVEQAIVDLRLTRGEGEVDDKWFAGSIENSAPPDEAVRDYYIGKLKALAQTEHGPVRAAAGKVLAHYASPCGN